VSSEKSAIGRALLPFLGERVDVLGRPAASQPPRVPAPSVAVEAPKPAPEEGAPKPTRPPAGWLARYLNLRRF